MSNFLKLIFVTLAALVMLTIGPWLLIWSINFLISASLVGAPAGTFIPHIAFTFYTWLAAVIIGGLSVLPSFKRKS